MSGRGLWLGDSGPSIGTPRWKVYAIAREIGQLAELARECSMAGAGENLPRALAQLDRIRAILGSASERTNLRDPD